MTKKCPAPGASENDCYRTQQAAQPAAPDADEDIDSFRQRVREALAVYQAQWRHLEETGFVAPSIHDAPPTSSVH